MSDLNQLKKQRLKSLILELLNEVPPPIGTMIALYRSSVMSLVDGLTDEQVDTIISKAKELISFVEGGGTDADTETHRTE